MSVIQDPESPSAECANSKLELTSQASAIAGRSAGLQIFGLSKRALSVILLLTICVFGVTSCSSEEGDKKGTSTASLKEKAEEAKEKASGVEAAKFASTSFEAGVEYFEKAEGEEDPLKANKLYKKARRKWDSAAKTSKSTKKIFDRLQTNKAKFTKLVAEQDKAKSNFRELSADAWAMAEEKFKDGEEKLAEKDYKKANTSFRTALSRLEDCLQEQKGLTKQRMNAIAAKGKMEAARDAAKDVPETATTLYELTQAKEAVIRAEEEFGRGEFEGATFTYGDAASYYKNALTMHKEETLRKAERAESERLAKEIADANNPNEKSTEAAESTDVPLPENGDDTSGDDLDVLAQLRNLYHSEVDLNNGQLSLGYPIGTGQDLRQDLSYQPANSKYLIFSGRANVGVSEYTVAGNTGGRLLIDAEFKDDVTIEFDLLTTTMTGDNDTNFYILFNCDDKFTTYYASAFGTNLMYRSFKGNSVKTLVQAPKAFRKHPNKWVNKSLDYHIKLRWKRRADGKAKFFAHYSAEGMDDVTMVNVESDKVGHIRGGKVGFMWKRTKWVIKNLEIKGAVDMEWAKKRVTQKSSSGGDDGFDDF